MNKEKANSDKSHLIMSCTEVTTAVIDDLPIGSSKTEVLLRITIDYELKFDDHANYLFKKAGQKLIMYLYVLQLLGMLAKNELS